ncbi:radical SAM family heme chaperone HemW [Marinobacterium arenosum]|uniref:radical SAM family heme chaperone HemW n=1 Tax=Marinobacterium arenosum TaxID=2862496 RepID=UPI001C94B843|nr:radical SAM family heme chaperone HemW [Marinobacterium arenosum]MBY4676422.1 radical SAM family heme chaperone HemW [Marinobacterium arenosum]
MTLPPLSLYIHIPWCVRKCPYCDFNSHAVRDELPEAEYVAALLADLDDETTAAAGREVASIFIGGGTPSLFSADSIADILRGVAARVPLAADAEITMEANPGTFEQERFAGFRAAGINRLSLGVQSFDDACLKALGRIHCAADAETAFRRAREIGFDNINIDLMHGLPGQTIELARGDLLKGLELAPDHLSWYQLTIEPNTEFHARPPSLPIDDTLWEIQQMGGELLAAQGYRQYEVSAYARDGRQAAHNLNYWQFGDYIGIGAGAHGKLTCADGRIMRRWKQRQPKAYLNPLSRLGGEQPVAVEELPFEFMMNVLRLTDGVPANLFSQRTGQPLSIIEPLLDQARRRGLLLDDPARLQPTDQGRLFLNDLLGLFLAD